MGRGVGGSGSLNGMFPIGHAGGGDEMLLALVPLLVFMIVYRLVRGPLPSPEGGRRQGNQR